MAQAARQRFTYEEYLQLEDVAEVKHEFLEGQVWAMAGGSPEHPAICGKVTTLLSIQLRDRKCRVYSSDLRVRVLATGLGTYPDVTVVCGRVERDPEDRSGHTVVNPSVVVEVLSPSTQEYDRGEKLEHYGRIPSLEAVVLVASERREIQVVARSSDGTWSRRVFGEGQTARVDCIGCDLPVAEVYRNPLEG